MQVKNIVAYLIYNLILTLLLPVALIYFIWRLVIKGKSRDGLSERFGFLPLLPDGANGRIWIHAVSAGEAVAARPILQVLKKSLPGYPLVLSTTTPAGNTMAKKGIPEADAVIYFPLDLPFTAGRSLLQVNPKLALTVETELWPNFFYIARLMGAKTAVVNGRVAGKTLKGAKKFGFLYRWVLSNLDLLCMQSKEDAERIISMGADPKRVRVVGNTKFDQPLPADSLDRLAALRKLMSLPEETPLFIAGSTNPGEEEPVIQAYLKARAEFPGLRLLIAPRQIERADEIIALLDSNSLRAVRRSQLTTESPAPDGSVVILDTMGELAVVFGLATVSFVGGSLIPKGGHSILQPLAWGKPVFFGPYMHKSKDSAELALSNKIGFQISDGEKLGDGLIELLRDPAQRQQISTRALDVIQQNRGAAERCVNELVSLLGSESNTSTC